MSAYIYERYGEMACKIEERKEIDEECIEERN